MRALLMLVWQCLRGSILEEAFSLKSEMFVRLGCVVTTVEDIGID